MKENKRTRKSIRRHVRWDRILGLLAVVVGIIVIIIMIVNRHSDEATAAQIETPNDEVNQYFEDIIAQETNSAELDEAEKEMTVDYSLLSGTDISRHNGEIVTDGDFVIVKATEGVGYVDPRFEENIQNALDNGQLCGVYHYARPDSGNMPTVEAEHFVETIKPYIGRVMLVLDWEEAEEIDNTVWVSAWMWQVYQMTGVRPVLYTSASVASNYDWTGISSQFDLWVACYVQDTADIPTHGIDEWDLSAWRTIIWQYSTTGGKLDRNVSSLTTTEWQGRCIADNQKVDGEDLMQMLSVRAE